MRSLVLVALVALVLSSAAFAQQSRVPGQLIGLNVTGGLRLQGIFVFSGNVEVAAGTSAGPITVFCNDFSTRVTPDNKWAIWVSLKSIIDANPNERGHVVTIKALQDNVNVIVEKSFDLTELERLIGRKLNFEEVHR